MEIDSDNFTEEKIISKSASSFILRAPNLKDGACIHALIARCPPLDSNSIYCNFLQASHFHQTSVIALSGTQVVGFISGYIRPDAPQTLFLWQAAVDPSQRGAGLAYQMLKHLLNRKCLDQIKQVETTITETNQASWRLFKKLDHENGNHGRIDVFLDKSQHFADTHETEFLYQIPLLA